ncbi:cyclic nucleotide-gated ion channel 1-like [Carya illinoinensis]|uniref:Cyclic nucleotide-binding domain-containing protein n=2 Tax=Carya illinoinensis TaxID=32201 RepID=A0A922F8N9_CARIL|nr:cyclic nucleotide-gated ion channel 1-like [Carya illinoinensis]KAG6715365.1 hypothetical protein I3842_05G248200 [Carya illinoinensis]
MSYRGRRQENGARDEDVEKQVANNNGVNSEEKKTAKMKILHPNGLPVRVWSWIFVVSSVIAVSVVDPLFLYVPVINEDEKCLALDTRLKTMAICLRAFTDVIYFVNIILQFVCPYMDEGARKVGRIKFVTSPWPIAKRYLLSWRFLIDILAILPLPQVLVPIIFREMRDPRYLDKRKVLSGIVLVQYVPRVMRIYISWRKLVRTANIIARIVWLKAAFNFFLYILASHVLGAFWYVFSIQRETACWYIACKKQNGSCVPSAFSCSHKRPPSLENYTFLIDYCPLDKPTKSQFDFGIFLDAIESGTVASKDYPKKMLYCFWWGLQNLSSFGQNLQTSNYFWENCFAVFISISGLLLFLYFIGNVQTYIQLTTARSEEVIQKMKIKKRDIDLWIKRNNLDDDIKPHIMPNILRVLEQNIDVDAQNPLPHLPIEIRRDIRSHLCLPMLKKVPMLQSEQHMLQSICESLRPVYFNERTYIVREGEPLDTMLFITQGIVWNFTTSRRVDGTLLSGECLERGHFYGEELLAWGFRGSPKPNLSDLPLSTKTVKTHTKVEGFVLMAKDLKTLISRRPTEAAFALQAAWRRYNGKKNAQCSTLARRPKPGLHAHRLMMCV